MEYAALLAGEPWTDQPRCTHPVLAALARLANDATTPTGRYRLVPLIPYVVGANPDDLHTAPPSSTRLSPQCDLREPAAGPCAAISGASAGVYWGLDPRCPPDRGAASQER
jgi:hypothetical protein